MKLLEVSSLQTPGNADTIALQSLAQKFCQTEYCLSKVGISHLTTFDQDGQASPNPVFPFKLTFLAADINFPETRSASHECNFILLTFLAPKSLAF